MINTSAYSYAASNYPDTVEKVVSWMESSVGVGCVFGPVMGSLVYQFVGYAKTFYIFGAVMAPNCLLVICVLKDTKEVGAMKINASNDVECKQQEQEEQEVFILPDEN